MDIEIQHRPSYSLAIVRLAPHERIRAEAGAMVSMSAGVNIETQAAGGLPNPSPAPCWAGNRSSRTSSRLGRKAARSLWRRPARRCGAHRAARRDDDGAGRFVPGLRKRHRTEHQNQHESVHGRRGPLHAGSARQRQSCWSRPTAPSSSACWRRARSTSWIPPTWWPSMPPSGLCRAPPAG